MGREGVDNNPYTVSAMDCTHNKALEPLTVQHLMYIDIYKLV